MRSNSVNSFTPHPSLASDGECGSYYFHERWVLGPESNLICLHLGIQFSGNEACKYLLDEPDFFFVHNSTSDLHLP